MVTKILGGGVEHFTSPILLEVEGTLQRVVRRCVCQRVLESTVVSVTFPDWSRLLPRPTSVRLPLALSRSTGVSF